MSNIAATVHSILADRLSLRPQQIQPHSRLVEDLGADSLDMVEIVMRLEEAFDIAISDEDAENIHTVAELLQQLGTQLAVATQADGTVRA